MSTQKFDYIEVGRTLEPKQRSMYFQIGSELFGRQNANRGYSNMDRAHEQALAALHSTNWKSMKAARAMLSVMRAW